MVISRKKTASNLLPDFGVFHKSMSAQSMNNKPWGPDDGELLQSIRQKAGIDALVFARANTLSLAQLQELEGGEGRGFYSELIKRNTGIKLLKKLGHEVPEPSTVATEPMPVTLQADASPPTTSVNKPGPAAAAHSGYLSGAVLMRPTLLTGALLTLGLLGFMGFQQLKSSPTERQEPFAVQRENAPPQSPTMTTTSVVVEASNAMSASSAIQAPDKALHIDARAAAVGMTAEPTQRGTVSCEEPHRLHSANHTPSNPLKPGNYIYIEARTDSQLCVLDSQNKLSTLTLKAGMNQTVNGVAPFLVHASNWQGLQVFFQGRPVRMEHEGNAHLMLNSLPL